VKDLLIGFGLFATTVIGTVTAWQDHVEWGLKVLSLLVAIGASTAAIVYYRTKTRALARVPAGPSDTA
jgi:hypothetical protein